MADLTIPPNGFKVAILDDYQGQALSLSPTLSNIFSHPHVNPSPTIFNHPLSDPSKDLAPFHILLTMRERTRFPSPLVQNLPNLRLLVTTGMRNAALDLKAFEDKDVKVLGCKSDSESTTELIWTLVMAGMRNIALEDRTMREDKALGWTTPGVMGRSLTGKTIGLVGYGRLGQRIARLASVFGLNILVWSPNMTASRLASQNPPPNTTLATSKQDLLSSSDIVSLHLVLSQTTKHIISFEEFRLMKKDALFVNTSRGGLVDSKALIEWLKDEEVIRVGGSAALDVYEEEPLGFDQVGQELRKLRNVILSPHMGYVTKETMKSFYDQSAENVINWLEGRVDKVQESWIQSSNSGYEKR